MMNLHTFLDSDRFWVMLFMGLLTVWYYLNAYITDVQTGYR